MSMIFAPAAIGSVGIGVVVLCLARLIGLQRRSTSPVRRLVEGVPLVLLIGGSATILALSFTDTNAFRGESPPGATVSVKGHHMRIDCQNSVWSGSFAE